MGNSVVALITMRQDYLEQRNEVRDSIDISLYELCSRLNLKPMLVPNDEGGAELLMETMISNCGLLILSGGNTYSGVDATASDVCLTRDKVEGLLINAALSNRIPIVGICRGMQVLCKYVGGEIVKVDGHINRNHVVYAGDKSFSVNSFHSFALQKIPGGRARVICRDSEGRIESCYIDDLNAVCFMWHPERKHGATEYSLDIIRRMLEMNKTRAID